MMIAIALISGNDFGLGLRPLHFGPRMGSGIFAQDGAQWRHSRQILRPQFMSNRSHLERIKSAAENLVASIPRNEPVDLQSLFFRLTFDTRSSYHSGDIYHHGGRRESSIINLSLQRPLIPVKIILRSEGDSVAFTRIWEARNSVVLVDCVLILSIARFRGFREFDSISPEQVRRSLCIHRYIDSGKRGSEVFTESMSGSPFGWQGYDCMLSSMDSVRPDC